MSKENRQHAEHISLEPSLRRSPADAATYASALKADYGFESECVRARFNYLLRHIKELRPVRILEVGCGFELFFDRAVQSAVDFDRWVVIEPASALARKAKTRAESDPRLLVIEGYCEDPAVDKAVRELGPFDMLLLSGVLHEVDEPLLVLKSALSLVGSGTNVVVTTPNALSFHRLLAVEMGLIPDAHTHSQRNNALQQRIVYDPHSLRMLLEEGGVGHLRFEGYLFKPFTHTQMGQILGLLPPDVCGGLENLGRQFPQHGAEIAYIGIKL